MTDIEKTLRRSYTAAYKSADNSVAIIYTIMEESPEYLTDEDRASLREHLANLTQRLHEFNAYYNAHQTYVKGTSA